MTHVTMYDDVNVSLLPAGGAAYGCYINGIYANEAAVRTKFPHAAIIRISVTASDHHGDCLDVERGDATNEEAPGWFKAVEGHTATPKPWIYTSASNINALMATMSHARIARSRYFIWSAHYTYTAHVCSPACGYWVADGTQWTDKSGGKSLDQSLVDTSMLPGHKPSPKPSVKPSPKPAAKPSPKPAPKPVARPNIDAATSYLTKAERANKRGPIRNAIIAALRALRGIRR